MVKNSKQSIDTDNSTVFGSNIYGSGNNIINSQSLHNASHRKPKTNTWIRVSCVLSSIAIVISIIAFCNKYIHCFHTQDSVSILLALATVLIAWQIIHYFHFINSIKEEFQRQITNTKADFNEQVLAIKKEVQIHAESTSGAALIQLAYLLYDTAKEETKSHITLLRSSFTLLGNGLLLIQSETELTSEARDKAITLLKQICIFFKDNGIKIHDQESLFFKAALKTNDKELISLILTVTIQPGNSVDR